MKVHMDGARLFNAAVALASAADVICREADTVQFCLSKGLGAPVGSIIAGTAEEMVRAGRYRKLLGGGMRQAGVVAAAGIHAARPPRRAARRRPRQRPPAGRGTGRRVAARGRPGGRPTNIVLAACTRDGDAAASVCDELEAVGVLAAPYDRTRIRFVTSLEVDAAGVEAAL